MVLYGPNVFSVYGLVHRTNNLVEIWHRWFNERCKRAHVNFWDFMRKSYTISSYLMKPNINNITLILYFDFFFRFSERIGKLEGDGL